MNLSKISLVSRILIVILFFLPLLFISYFYTINTSNVSKNFNQKEEISIPKENFVVPNKPLKNNDFWDDFYNTFSKGLCENHGENRTSNADQKKQVKKIISTVAKEMGADKRLFFVWARRESNYRPFVRHEKRADVIAAIQGWKRHHPKTKEYRSKLKEKLSRVDSQDKRYKIMFELALRETYKNNPYYHDFQRWTSGGLGLYGMNLSYYTKKWDVNAPPEILCDPIIATVIAVWSARDAMNTCIAQGYKPTYSVVNRGFSRGGNCHPNEKDSDFALRAKSNGIKKERNINLGEKWDSKKSNREVLYKNMVKAVY